MAPARAPAFYTVSTPHLGQRVEAVLVVVWQEVVVVDTVLVAAGRSPNVAGLGLEAAGVQYDYIDGIKVRLVPSPRLSYGLPML